MSDPAFAGLEYVGAILFIVGGVLGMIAGDFLAGAAAAGLGAHILGRRES